MYYIYMIPGIKIGCTKNVKRRMYRQHFDEYIILEEHEDINIASERELILQKEWGFSVDNNLYSTMHDLSSNFAWKNNTEERKKEAGRNLVNSLNNAWKNRNEHLLNAAKENIKKATLAASKSKKRASTQTYKCEDCDKIIKGAGPAGYHSKTHSHKIVKL